MIEISTPTLNSVCNEVADIENLDCNLTASEITFYEEIKPVLDNLKKEPSNQVIENILNFSKNL